MKRFFRTLLSLVCAAVVSNAHAQTAPSAPTSPWSLALGAVHMNFNTKADLYAGGPVPGAGVNASDDTVLGLEIAYSLNPNWTARLDIGTPVKTDCPALATSGLWGVSVA